MNIGEVCHGSLRPEDLFDSFHYEALRRAKKARNREDVERLERLAIDWQSIETDEAIDELDESEEVRSSIIAELIDFLNLYALPYTYFGAHEGDGSCFGFWPCFDSLEELPNYDSFPDTLPGEDFRVTNDHGNLSVYGADGKLLWDCV